jgi:hypothetical protein
MLRGVTGRVERLDQDVAHGEAVAVAEQDGPVGGRESVAPVVPTLVREVEPRLGPGGELAGPGAEVGVDVGLGDVGDAELERGGQGEVLVDVTVGVDDERFLRLDTPDEVARLRELGVPDPMEQH